MSNKKLTQLAQLNQLGPNELKAELNTLCKLDKMYKLNKVVKPRRITIPSNFNGVLSGVSVTTTTNGLTNLTTTGTIITSGSPGTVSLPMGFSYKPDTYYNGDINIENMFNALFTYVEKVEYLESIGYHVIVGASTMAGKPEFEGGPNVFEPLQVVFVREMTIKLKNTLLAKPVLKMKL